jgi:hypothetical protein
MRENTSEISGSHGSKYEEDIFLAYRNDESP